MSRSTPRGNSGWISRLWFAVEYNDQHSLRALLAQGINVNHAFKEAGHRRHNQTPLFISVAKNNRELTNLLLNAGSDIEYADSCGETVLFMAVRHGKMPMVRLLVNHGANINHQNKKGESVLFDAVKFGRKDTLDYLLSVGADTDLQNEDGATPLLLALELYDNTCRLRHVTTRRTAPSNLGDIISTLIPLCSDINHQHPNWGSPLRIALAVETNYFRDSLRLSKMLLQHGAIPDRLFFLRFGGLNASTSKPGSEFFTEKFFNLALAAGASLQREKTWLITVLAEMPQELAPYEQLFNDLLEKSMSPPSLQNSCLIYIRKTLHGRLWLKIDTLPLPETIKDCLKLKF